MRDSGHRTRALLFLAAVILPSAVLVGTTLRLIGHERELAARRWEETRRALALRLGAGLLDRIEGLERGHPALLTQALVQDGTLLFPWDQSNAIKDHRSSQAGEYLALLRRAEELEFRNRDPRRAAILYGQAASMAEDPALLAEARVHQGRALVHAGSFGEAENLYRELAGSPHSLLDREGMPFSLYGIEALLRLGAPPTEVVEAFVDLLEGLPLYSAPVLFAVGEIAEEAAAGGLSREEQVAGAGSTPPIQIPDSFRRIGEQVRNRIRVLDLAEGLRRDFPNLVATAERAQDRSEARESTTWICWGPEPWVVGLDPGSGHDTARVTIVRPDLLLAEGFGFDPETREVASQVNLLGLGDTRGEALGPELPGLRAIFPLGVTPPPEGGTVEGWFFRILLPLILLLTAFAAYLAWRDVRRETEAATLRSHFVSSVTHELKTPLTSIRMFAETLLLGRNAGPNHRTEYLETIVHETERLSRLINNVLDFARIDRGEKSYHFTPTHLGKVVQEAIQALSYPINQEGFTLSVEIPKELPVVEADEDALIQALLNLLTNAMKFSGDSRGIGLSVGAEEGEVIVQVLDRGQGIAPEDREAIFRDFYRTPEAEGLGIPGTGLGLSLVAHVARAHGGRVEVESRPGGGSIFTIRLPTKHGRGVPTDREHHSNPGILEPDGGGP